MINYKIKIIEYNLFFIQNSQTTFRHIYNQDYTVSWRSPAGDNVLVQRYNFMIFYFMPLNIYYY